MGFWGPKAFENDAAHDWFRRVEESGIDRIRQDLTEAAVHMDSPFESERGASLIALATVIAASRTHELSDLPEAPRKWLSANRPTFSDDEANLAAVLVRRIVDFSELQGLWQEDPDGKAEWEREAGNIIKALSQRNPGDQFESLI